MDIAPTDWPREKCSEKEQTLPGFLGDQSIEKPMGRLSEFSTRGRFELD
jgi:hypothetical protein